MSEPLRIRLQNAEKTAFCGASLTQTLYRFPLTVLCLGPLGAGKTTFVQGLARAMGIHEAVTSPTFALEQRYRTGNGMSFLHLDLFRLTPIQAAETIRATDDHEGIRCIEWADRLPSGTVQEPTIIVALEEWGSERIATITFDDLPLASSKEITEWRSLIHLPQHIIDHCDAVGTLAAQLGMKLIEDGQIVRLDAVRHSGELHDLFRFIDFSDGAGPDGLRYPNEAKTMWAHWTSHWRAIKSTMKHEEACARFLTEKGYPELARMIEVHGLMLPSPDRTTVEQKLLFYADKRVQGSRVVTLQERFEDFCARYSSGKDSALSKAWYKEARRVERELFSHGISPMLGKGLGLGLG